MRVVICQHQKEPLFTKSFFLLLVTPDIPPDSGNNDPTKRLSYVRYFSLKKLKEGASLWEMRNSWETFYQTLLIATRIETDKGQPQKLCVSVDFTPISLVCILRCFQAYHTLSNYLKLQQRQKQPCRCKYYFCCMYIYVLYSEKLADLPPLFIMPFTTISTITFYLNMLFLNFRIQSFSKGLQLPS